MVCQVRADAVVVHKQVILVMSNAFGEVPKIRGDHPSEHHCSILAALRDDIPLQQVMEDFESCFVAVRFLQRDCPESVLHIVTCKMLVAVKAVDDIHQLRKGVLIVHGDLIQKAHVNR